jgi:hypothetical protein
MYPLIQEAVEIHDLGVTLRKMARLSLRCGTAAVDPRNTPDESAHYLQRQAKYYDEVFDLRNRPRARLDELMADQKFKGTENGAIQVKRLKDIKTSISGDPFTDLDMEDLGWELTRTKEPNFWVQDAMPTTSAETSTLRRQSHTETSPWEWIDVPLAIADGTSLSQSAAILKGFGKALLGLKQIFFTNLYKYLKPGSPTNRLFTRAPSTISQCPAWPCAWTND